MDSFEKCALTITRVHDCAVRLVKDYRQLIVRLESDGPGPRSGSLEPGRASGSHSDPTATAAIHPDHGFPYDIDRLLDTAKRAEKEMSRLVKELPRVLPLPLVKGELRRIPCANPNCAKVIDNDSDTQVRKERCSPCYQYLNRTGMDAPLHVVLRRSINPEVLNADPESLAG